MRISCCIRSFPAQIRVTADNAILVAIRKRVLYIPRTQPKRKQDHKLARALNIILLASFLVNCSNISYLLLRNRKFHPTARETCGCSAAICCCSGKANTDAANVSICRPGGSGLRHGENPVVAGPNLTSCNPLQTVFVMPALKEALPLANGEQNLHFPTSQNVVKSPRELIQLEVYRRIDRPPRPATLQQFPV